MTPVEIRIAKRVATYMLEIAQQQIDLNFFQGLGLALGVIYEEITGRGANDKKPQDIILWAQNLPEVRYPHVKD